MRCHFALRNAVLRICFMGRLLSHIDKLRGFPRLYLHAHYHSCLCIIQTLGGYAVICVIMILLSVPIDEEPPINDVEKGDWSISNLRALVTRVDSCSLSVTPTVFIKLCCPVLLHISYKCSLFCYYWFIHEDLVFCACG